MIKNKINNIKSKISMCFFIRRSNKFYNLLKNKCIKRKSYIGVIDGKHIKRGMGSTYNLVRLAREFNAPFICANSTSIRFAKELERKIFGDNKIKFFSQYDELRGLKFDICFFDWVKYSKIIQLHKISDCIIGIEAGDYSC